MAERLWVIVETVLPPVFGKELSMFEQAFPMGKALFFVKI